MGGLSTGKRTEKKKTTTTAEEVKLLKYNVLNWIFRQYSLIYLNILHSSFKIEKRRCLCVSK